MLAEQIGPYGVAAGLVFATLTFVALLFSTDFPLTSHVKQLRIYPVLAGAHATFVAVSAFIFGVATAALTFDLVHYA